MEIKIFVTQVFLIMLIRGTHVSGVVLFSNPNFDVIQTSNLKEEVTFYGLGLNFSLLTTNYTQRTLWNPMECKIILQTVPALISAFARIQDNGTVLCSLFQQPIFMLPTISEDKASSFAFYKKVPPEWNGYLNEFTYTGKFFVGSMPHYVTYPELMQYCHENFPNSGLLNLKTKLEFYSFRSSVFATYYGYYGLNVKKTTVSDPEMVWGDGTKVSSSESFSLFYSVDTSGPIFSCYRYTDNDIRIVSQTATGLIFRIMCEVDPFMGP